MTFRTWAVIPPGGETCNRIRAYLGLLSRQGSGESIAALSDLLGVLERYRPGTWVTLSPTIRIGRILPMTWRETSPMKECILFIRAYHSGLFSFTDLCQHYDISRKTGYKWLKRFLAQGPDGLRDQPRVPRSCPLRIYLGRSANLPRALPTGDTLALAGCGD